MYELRYEDTEEKKVEVIGFQTKKEAHLYWINSMRTYILGVTNREKKEKGNYKIQIVGGRREVICREDGKIKASITKLY